MVTGVVPERAELVKDAKRLVQFTPFESAQFKTVAGGKAVFYTASISPDGGQLAAVSQDGAWRVWDAASGKQLAALAADELAGVVDELLAEEVKNV